MLSAPFLATTYAISETGFLPLFFRIPWKSPKNQGSMNTSNNQALKQYFKQYLTEVRGVSERTVSHDNTSLRTVER